MQLTTKVRKNTAILLAAAAIALATTACFPDSAPGQPSDSYAAGIFQAVNQDRANNGLPALGYSPKLTNQAGNWAWQMMHDNTLYHQNLSALLSSSDYSNYYTLGENIIVAPGNYTPAQLEAAWMASAPHRANILSSSFNVMGTGEVWGPDGRVWAVVDFGGLS